MSEDDPRREPGDEHQRQKLPGKFSDLNLRDEAAQKGFLDALKATGVQIATGPIEFAANPLIADNTLSYTTTQQGTISTAHERLSAAVYELARKIERNTIRDGAFVEGLDFLEELMADIAKMPLSSEVAIRLATSPPPRDG
jgi:hypothetical protein